ncbi:MAG: sigma-54-dependent Fis family transcriptional regulator [Bacteroidales bacterium]|nr:sigma-54-dependent Fis family transcriptional regulator [Bacteroidales bacterium]MEE0900347.1 sigma-54 dependent transcriptional regulator [Bacteroidales bacterium]
MSGVDVQTVKKQFRIFGDSPLLNRAIDIAIRVAKTDASVLIVGESGAGKDVFSKIIHQNSSRKQRKYIAVNCAAIPEGTIESELFGHVKGSFTGAEKDRRGYFAEADKGTIFLDEVGELPYTMQAKLLRVIENGEFLPVGASSAVKVDVRIVAATNVNLLKAVEQGRFRSDLYYRLNQINISVPSLRERKDDIPLLFRYFCSEISEKYNIPRINLSSDALTYLSNYPWRGNIRELKNIAERISLLEMDREIDVVKLKTYIPPIESLPVPIESEEYYDDKDDIIRIILQNKKDIEELKEEVHKLKSVVIGLFNSSSSTAMLVPPTEEEVTETVIDYPEETVKKEESVNLRELEKKAIIAALERNGGKRSAAAKELGFSERTLYRKMIEYDLNTKR